MAQNGCPNCGSSNLIECSGVSRESHGESFEESWLECVNCGARFEPDAPEHIAPIIERVLR